MPSCNRPPCEVKEWYPDSGREVKTAPSAPEPRDDIDTKPSKDGDIREQKGTPRRQRDEGCVPGQRQRSSYVDPSDVTDRQWLASLGERSFNLSGWRNIRSASATPPPDPDKPDYDQHTAPARPRDPVVYPGTDPDPLDGPGKPSPAPERSEPYHYQREGDLY